MIVDNLMRLTLESSYIDLIDDRITVINHEEKAIIMKSDIIGIKSEEYKAKTSSNNIRVSTKVATHTYVSKSFDTGSREYKRGELIIHYNYEGSEKWICLYDSNTINVNAINRILNEWLNGAIIPSEKVKNYNERKKTLKFKIGYYLPMILFISLGIYILYLFFSGFNHRY